MDNGPQVGVQIVDRQGNYLHCMRCIPGDAPSTPLYAVEVGWKDKCDKCGRVLIGDLDAHLAKMEAELTAYVVATVDLDMGIATILDCEPPL